MLTTKYFNLLPAQLGLQQASSFLAQLACCKLQTMAKAGKTGLSIGCRSSMASAPGCRLPIGFSPRLSPSDRLQHRPSPSHCFSTGCLLQIAYSIGRRLQHTSAPGCSPQRALPAADAKMVAASAFAFKWLQPPAVAFR